MSRAETLCGALTGMGAGREMLASRERGNQIIFSHAEFKVPFETFQ